MHTYITKMNVEEEIMKLRRVSRETGSTEEEERGVEMTLKQRSCMKS